MNTGYEFDSLQFIKAGGIVSAGVAITLLLMSIASWYLILVKGYQAWRLRLSTRNYIRDFWQTPALQTGAQQADGSIPAAAAAQQAIRAADHYQRQAQQAQGELCSRDEFIARSMRKTLGRASAQLERGMTVLASVGSVAPFIGLFGTVWGIYHALASISLSGQATLDKVAGPVGESLIMTGLGLAVAIPAVLGYNAYVRMNRTLLAETDAFAQEVHVLLTTGAALRDGPVAAVAGEKSAAARLHEVSA